LKFYSDGFNTEFTEGHRARGDALPIRERPVIEKRKRPPEGGRYKTGVLCDLCASAVRF
jgi:hypothetical protein